MRGSRYLVAGALALLGFEALGRARPAILPAPFDALAAQRLLDREIYVHDPGLGHCLRPSYERRLGRDGAPWTVRHEPLGAGASCGFRAGTGGSPMGADIVLLGDSHVYGMEVDGDATWAALLGRGAGLRVANLGVRMYAASQSAALFRRHGPGLRPGLVVLLLCPNDPWEDSVFEDWRRGVGLREPARSDEMLYRVCRSLGLDSRPAACRAAAGFARWGLAPQLLVARSIAALRAGAEARDSRSGLALVLRDARDLSASAGPARLAAVINEGWPADSRRDLAEGLRAAGIPFLDLSAAPGAGDPRARIPLDGHWNAAGHRWVAAEVRGFLEREGLLPVARARAGP